MHVIATAGHVDHGKSRLVNVLTGMDPDRLEEEKRRGLTIDLGFAWLKLPSGREVGIVDVPGHERFIKNMLAGVGAVNVTLFVVAANEGWKPQSQEHLDILDLLGVDAAIVAITKADLVDEHRVHEVTEQVSDYLKGTTLEDSKIVPVSSATGDGLNELVQTIEILLDTAKPAEDQRRPRLWIDRVFSMRGSGTVVTGTLIGGSLSRQDEVAILPSGSTARIRAIQSHRKEVERLGPGNRSALNLSGIDPGLAKRGDVVSLPGHWITTRRALTFIRFLKQLPHEPSERGAFKFYVGSAERDAKIRFIDGEPEAGASLLAHIELNEPVVLDWRDRFVVRDAGRRETLGGGEVLEPHPPLGRRLWTESARRRQPVHDRWDYVGIILDEERVLAKNDLWIRAGIDPSRIESIPGVHLKNLIASEKWFESNEQKLMTILSDHHRANPLEAGVPREAVRAVLGIDGKTFEEVVAELHRRGRLVSEETFLRLPEHLPSPAGPEYDELVAELDKAGASPPTVGELQARFEPSLIKALVRSGELVQVNAELVFPAAWIESLKKKLKELLGAGPMTVASFRDEVGTTRKYAVPLLEYFDQIGFTRRRGDVRVAGPNAQS
jgi:selenocysteine-specific elongation factor